MRRCPAAGAGERGNAGETGPALETDTPTTPRDAVRLAPLPAALLTLDRGDGAGEAGARGRDLDRGDRAAGIDDGGAREAGTVGPGDCVTRSPLL